MRTQTARVYVAFLFVTVVAMLFAGACSQTNLCAAQQDPSGPLLSEWLVALSPTFTPHPRGYNASAAEEGARSFLASAIGLCGQPVCAANAADARAAFAAAIGDHNLAEPTLFVFYLGLTPADALGSNAAANAAWNQAGGPCYGGPSPFPKHDGGGAGGGGTTGPCRLLGEPCDSSGATLPDCCPTQQIVSGSPASVLECEPTDIDVNDQIGTCHVDVWQPCLSDGQCFQSVTPDTQPLVCQGGVCCAPEGQGCWGPVLGSDVPLEGCCQGYTCVPDTIGNDWWCQ